MRIGWMFIRWLLTGLLALSSLAAALCGFLWIEEARYPYENGRYFDGEVVHIDDTDVFAVMFFAFLLLSLLLWLLRRASRHGLHSRRTHKTP